MWSRVTAIVELGDYDSTMTSSRGTLGSTNVLSVTWRMETALKSIRLPETDIANLAFKSYDFKVGFLSNWLKPKKISGSYEPLRQSVGEAANVELPLLPDLETTTLEQLEALVIRACKGDSKRILMNLAPVRAIRKFVDEREATAEFLDTLPMALYPGMRYSFWAPMLVRYEGAVRIVFMDLRRTGGMSASGLHVCFSIMHERFRALNPDFATVKFEAWRFSNNDKRSIRPIEEWGVPLSYERIVEDVAETYAILNALRSGDMGRATGTDDGPLFR
jgi:hypothetical protein